MVDLIELKSRARTLQPVIRIGKNGLNKGVIGEIEKALKKRKLIKIKLLNNVEPELRERIINEIMSETGAMLVDKIGGIIVIFRPFSR
jgi:RNA-binding protein